MQLQIAAATWWIETKSDPAFPQITSALVNLWSQSCKEPRFRSTVDFQSLQSGLCIILVLLVLPQLCCSKYLMPFAQARRSLGL